MTDYGPKSCVFLHFYWLLGRFIDLIPFSGINQTFREMFYQDRQMIKKKLYIFRFGSKTGEPSGVDRRSWRWAPSSFRIPLPRLCSLSVVLPPALWAPGCSWSPGSPPRSPPPLRCSRSRASSATRKASQALTRLLLLRPCPLPCHHPSSTPQPWDTALTCLTSALCACRPRHTSAQLIRGTPVLLHWGWRLRSTFSLLGRHGDAGWTLRPLNTSWWIFLEKSGFIFMMGLYFFLKTDNSSCPLEFKTSTCTTLWKNCDTLCEIPVNMKPSLLLCLHSKLFHCISQPSPHIIQCYCQ